jgi:hypothetical protein
MNNSLTMPPPVEAKKAKPTAIDYELAVAYFPVLVELAAAKSRTSYSGLVELAKAKYLDNDTVQNAIAVSTGRRLDIVRDFTNAQRLPDLSSIVVNKQTGECGIGFTRSFDPIAVRAEVYAHDWTRVKLEFDGYVAENKKSLTPTKKRRISYDEAGKLMFDYYFKHKAKLPPKIKEHREAILALLIEGLEVEDAFAEALRDDA